MAETPAASSGNSARGAGHVRCVTVGAGSGPRFPTLLGTEEGRTSLPTRSCYIGHRSQGLSHSYYMLFLLNVKMYFADQL